MSRLFIITSLLTVLACQQSQPARINEVSISPINDLKYSEYGWYYPTGNWEFYLNYYVHIKENGQFSLMIRDDFMSKPKYYNGFIDDTVRNIISKTFAIDTFKTEYTNIPNIAYDGFTYCLDIKSDSSHKKIIFYPFNVVPLRRLSKVLENLVKTSKPVRVDTIYMEAYVKDLQQSSFLELEPPPQIVEPRKRPS